MLQITALYIALDAVEEVDSDAFVTIEKWLAELDPDGYYSPSNMQDEIRSDKVDR